MIRLENVSKLYRDKKTETVALSGLTLHIRQGEFVALLGPSGCGKSTTLMLLAGLLKPSGGHIYFNDNLVNDLEPKYRNIGMVFQSYALYPHMTVLDNIAFPLKQRKQPKHVRYAKAREVAAIVQIGHLLDRRPGQLSGGQQQRVAMARALAKDPDILLLDEPMSNLDARLKLDVRDEIRSLQMRLGVTTVIVTHDQEEAMAISDKVAVLDGGKIQQFDTPDRLFRRPANAFVAHFLGSPPMNMLEGRLRQHDGRLVAAMNGFDYEIPASRTVAGARDGAPIQLGVRPEDVVVCGADDPGAIRVQVQLVEHLGSDALVKVVPLTDPQAQPLRLVTRDYAALRAGDTIAITFKEDRFHLFDRDNGGINMTLSDADDR